MVSGISYTRITLALDIIKKITEGQFAGFHELGIVKQQIDLGDTITIEKSDKMKVNCSHPMVPNDETNICWQAAELLKAEFGIKDNVSIHIDKKIPVQGGLAGGSANAAEVLRLLFDFWKLDLKIEEKLQLSRKLGMDVPFYFYGKTAFDTEAGGVLHPIENDCKLHFLLVIPPFGVSTKEAYLGIDYTKIGRDTQKTQNLIDALKFSKIDEIAENIHNDFEQIVYLSRPELSKIKNQVLDAGAKAVFMSGSGSTMVGLFSCKKEAELAAQKFEKVVLASTL